MSRSYAEDVQSTCDLGPYTRLERVIFAGKWLSPLCTVKVAIPKWTSTLRKLGVLIDDQASNPWVKLRLVLVHLIGR
jgi:hypothetical protein